MNIHDTAAGILSYILQSGLLLVVGLAAPGLFRLRHPKTLLVYWRTLLPVVVLLPLATAFWKPESPLPILAIDGGVVEDVVATTLPQATTVINWTVLLIPILAVTTLALLRIAVGLAYLGRCRRTAVPVDPLPERVQDLQRRFGLHTPFLSTERLSVPVTFGWARPIVMVPSSFGRLSADEQEGVACHELLHIRRRDWPVTLAEEIVRAILWFHPGVWILLARTALCREQVVDTGTVAMTGKRRQYLDALWQIVCSSRGRAAAVAVPLIGRSHLRARVEHLKREIVMSKTRIIVSGVCLATVVIVAGMVGATVFASTSAVQTDTFSLANPWSTGDDKPAEKEKKTGGGDKKLETFDHKGECGEITHPEVMEKVNPKYPEEARKAKIMGDVILRSTINDQGVVEDLEVLESPHELLTTASVEAVKQWRFDPALCDGRPVGVYYNLTVRFNLK